MRGLLVKDGKNHKSKKIISNFIKNKKMESVSQVATNVKEDVKSTVTTKYLVGVGVGLAVLFATVWVVGKAWRKSQKA